MPFGGPAAAGPQVVTEQSNASTAGLPVQGADVAFPRHPWRTEVGSPAPFVGICDGVDRLALKWPIGEPKPPSRPNHSELDPQIRDEIVRFLRDWLPSRAVATYRQMILSDPEGWWKHPHFAGGIILEHALRGNGITERVVGVRSLDALWPQLLEEAVLYEPDPADEA